MNTKELGLPTRTQNTLRLWGIYTVKQLLEKTSEELLNIPKMGITGVKAIQDALSRQGKPLHNPKPGIVPENECFNAKVHPRYPSIFCAAGHPFYKWSKTVSLDRLIQGRPLEMTVCQDCPDFVQMDPPGYSAEDRGWKE